MLGYKGASLLGCKDYAELEYNWQSTEYNYYPDGLQNFRTSWPNNLPTMKRIAYAQVELPDGTLLKRQVVEFSEGLYLRHYPLTEELAFTEWRNEKYIIRL